MKKHKMVNFDIQGEYERQEKARKEALTRGDALTYYQSCNELGISGKDLEDTSLYDIGQLEQEGLEQGTLSTGRLEQRLIVPRLPQEKRVSKAQYEKHKGFLEEVESLGVPMDRFEWRSEKEKLLRKHYRTQFGRKTNFPRMNDAQVSVCFKNVVKSAREIASRYEQQEQ